MDNQSAARGTVPQKGPGSFTMKVDQNSLAKDPNEGVAQWNPVVA